MYTGGREMGESEKVEKFEFIIRRYKENAKAPPLIKVPKKYWEVYKKIKVAKVIVIPIEVS
ncbi:MAG: hypothetical protein DRO13_04885 [Thermoprotei archaeon]|nr:MAG: hypothetical protein DRO13_04885 [Thermoprotei archaeon]